MSIKTDWGAVLATLGMLLLLVLIFSLMVGWRPLLSHLWVLGVSWALFLGFIRVIAFVDGLPEHRKRFGQVLAVVALLAWLVAAYYLIGPADEEVVRGR